MANNKLKEYEPEYCQDARGEYYKIPIAFKGGSLEVKIDIADFERFSEHNWSVLTVRGVPRYISRVLPTGKDGKRRRQQLHQFIMGVKHTTHVDHINGDGFDNRSDNVRIATAAENARNSVKRMRGTSVYKGVCWNKKNKRWIAQIKYKGKAMYLGSFSQEVIKGVDEGEVKAARCYDMAAVKYFGTFALLNLPEERNIVISLKGEHYRSSYLFNEIETRKIEVTIKELQRFNAKEIMEILEAMGLKEIVDMCHYFGCGIDELIQEIRRGVKGIVPIKKHA